MRLVNESHYDTGALRGLLREALTRWRKMEPPRDSSETRRLANLHVTVRTKRGRERRRGFAYFNSNRVWLVLPMPLQPSEVYSAARLVATFYHELHHCMGWDHNQMSLPVISGMAGWASDWPAVPTHAAARAPFPRAERLAALREDRSEHAVRMFARWQRRLRIAEGRLKVWQRRVNYYEKNAIGENQ